MVVDAAWMKRNLGFDPTALRIPQSSFAPEDLEREIIDFDSVAPEGRHRCWALIATE